MLKVKLTALVGAAGALVTLVALPTPAQAHIQLFVPCSATALRTAVNQANTLPGPDTLFLAPGCTYTLTAADNPGNGLPKVISDINVIGNGSTIRRQSATDFRILEVSGPGGRLTLNNVTVSEGRSALGAGGGIVAYAGTTLTLNSTTVTKNRGGAGVDGGGVFSGGTLIVRNSTVTYNYSSENGGGIAASNGTATISGSTIAGNAARSDGGGIDGTNATLTVTNSNITDNAAQYDAGGIAAYNTTGTVTDTLIRGNVSADGIGGGATTRGGSNLTLLRTNVFANRSFGDGGGGLANRGSTLTVRDSPVTRNSAGVSTPGGIFNESGTVNLTGTTTVTENIFTNCAPTPIGTCTD
ncbi:right-handed parallel beta-helix repeat-containing protein [Streptomyces racemochromogenes]|uniref:right-handed parallel beta-helix repeat-containing protein n=1 Tax=Streptomyces racemochromogenes TaxID=67353 RepID=UPI0035EC86B7